MLPAIFFLEAFVYQMIFDSRELMPAFVGTRSQDPEAGIIVLLLTFPTATCCFYALGIRWKETDHGQ